MAISKRAQGHLIALITIFIWGTTYISTKVLLTDFKPIEILFFRFVLGYFTLWILSPRLFAWQGIRQELMFLAAGFCGVTSYFLCENIALTYTTASNVGVIASLAPVFTAILAIFFLKAEIPPVRFYIGCLLAILGVALISFNGKFVLSLNLLGDLLAVIACLFWAGYSILTKKSSSYDYNIILLTRRFFFYGLILMLPALYIFDFEWGLSRFAKLTNVFNILFLGLGASAICFASWNYAVKLVGAVKISIYIYLVPIITIVTAMLILKESFTWIAAVGTLLTLSGVLLSEGKIRVKRK
ncbi:DMT family transporter [Snodgrassella alvi]|uniref:DMT family transporter n=1 Tax=Snodgrassella alvi TaxID=1196083 RepID=UPI000C1F198B|nr:DMT family transporter [Snodgrassella alvi]PIT14209.1 multidrug transporter [Snodgrassella alvi]PIT16726.1 multidrug transporter [Snodgrassella alvi]